MRLLTIFWMWLLTISIRCVEDREPQEDTKAMWSTDEWLAVLPLHQSEWSRHYSYDSPLECQLVDMDSVR